MLKSWPRMTAQEWKKTISRSPDLPGVAFAPAVVVKSAPFAVEMPPESESPTLTWTVSTAAIDRDDDTIDQNGWMLDNYRKGGSLLWAHEWDKPPIGKPLAIWVEEGKLKSTFEFTPQDVNPFGWMIYRMARGGFVRGTSVGFKPIDFDSARDREGNIPLDFKKQDLLEISVTPVPSNPEALLEARSAGIELAPLRGWIEQTKDGGLFVPPDITRDELDHAWRVVREARTYSIPQTETESGRAKDAEVKEPEIMQSLQDHLKAVAETREKLTSELTAHIKAFAEPLAVIAKSGLELTAEQVESLQELQGLIAGLLPRAEEVIPEAAEVAAEVVAEAQPEPEAAEESPAKQRLDEFSDEQIEELKKQIDTTVRSELEQIDRETFSRLTGRID